MRNTINTLRLYRKQSHLTQADIAYLLNHSDNSSISRCESGDRPISIEILLAYHLLFNTQLGDFFVQQRDTIRHRIASRIKPLVARIEKESDTPKSKHRVDQLLKTLVRLNDGKQL
ncbi:MAG: helix-turn-helix domain-containing protein [Flavobacteriales bacterium]|nr:helix-turn-helix domain-containing protein [Flavobacteriales bacterium]